MGFFDKVKELFTDEVEEEVEPIKKEMIKVEIASPSKEEETELKISDSEIINKDEKQPTPVFFSDSDFEDLRYTGFKEKTLNKNLYNSHKNDEKKEEKKFKLSPIISPVYGILDKNYSKDDISVKKIEKQVISTSSITTTQEIDVDSVRKKAFGTLEEELENQILNSNSILFKEELEEPVEKDLFEELKNKDESSSHNNNEIKETKDSDVFDDFSFEDITINDAGEEKTNVEIEIEESMVVDELEKMFESDNKITAENEKTTDSDEKLTEKDLFDLIDSMYEKGEDSNG